MLQNAYLLAKIGADTAENERNFADILPKIGNYPTGKPGGRKRPARRRGSRRLPEGRALAPDQLGRRRTLTGQQN